MQAPASKDAGLPKYGVRNAYQKQQAANQPELAWDGPGNIATFIRCLRLLDLDLRDDCPGLHERLFSTKNSQQNLHQRVKCVEWGLYCLFEIWDPGYTKDVRNVLSASVRSLMPPHPRNFGHSSLLLPSSNRSIYARLSFGA